MVNSIMCIGITFKQATVSQALPTVHSALFQPGTT